MWLCTGVGIPTINVASFPAPFLFRLYEGQSQDLASNVMFAGQEYKGSRNIIIEHSCYSQMSEGSKSTLLVANLYSLFVPQRVRSREIQPPFESVSPHA